MKILTLIILGLGILSSGCTAIYKIPGVYPPDHNLDRKKEQEDPSRLLPSILYFLSDNPASEDEIADLKEDQFIWEKIK